MNILTTGRSGKEFCHALKDNTTDIVIKYVEELSEKDIIWADCLASFPVSEQIDLSGIKWIHSFGAGVEKYLQRKDINEEILLSRTVGKLGYKMGEYCLCHLLNFFQNTFYLYSRQKLKKWTPEYPESVNEKYVLILGTGEMAKGIAGVLRKLDINVVGLNKKGYINERNFNQCITFRELKPVASNISCVINTLPLHKNTTHLLDKDFFHHFKHILFINVGRGKTVVTKDLEEAISSGNVAFAVLDVFEEEPLPPDSSLWNNDHIFISPHQAAITDVEDIISSFLDVYQSVIRKEFNPLFVEHV